MTELEGGTEGLTQVGDDMFEVSYFSGTKFDSFYPIVYLLIPL